VSNRVTNSVTNTDQDMAAFKRRQLRWIIVIAGFPVATLLRMAVAPFLPPGLPFITYFPLVLLVAVVGGKWPAIVATLLSAISALYLFIEPIGSIVPTGPKILVVVLFIVVSGATIAVIERMAQLQRRAAGALAASVKIAADHAAMAEQATASRQRLDVIFQQLPVGIIEIDLHGSVLLANNLVASLLNRPIETIIGSQLADYLHIADRADLADTIVQLVKGERSISQPLRPVAVGLPPLVLHMTLARDGKGTPQSVLAKLEEASVDPRDKLLGSPARPWLRRP
jgi:PAS domain-containing protein